MGYRKVDPQIWNDEKFRNLSDDGQLVFLFVLTHPQMTSVGAMRATLPGLAAEKKWELERFRKAFEEGFQKGMILMDEEASFIVFPNFLYYNGPENPNVVKAWAKALKKLPECDLKTQLIEHIKEFLKGYSEPFQTAFHEELDKLFNKAFHKAFAKPFQKGLPKQEQEQEQDIYLAPPNGGTCPESPEIRPADPEAELLAEEKAESPRHKPEDKIVIHGGNGAPPCPHKSIIDLYHKVLPELPEVRIWNETQKGYLRARWKEDKQRQSLEWWESYFKFIRESDFLMGRKSDFMADLEWLVRPKNFAKIANGRYHTRKKPGWQVWLEEKEKEVHR